MYVFKLYFLTLSLGKIGNPDVLHVTGRVFFMFKCLEPMLYTRKNAYAQIFWNGQIQT